MSPLSITALVLSIPSLGGRSIRLQYMCSAVNEPARIGAMGSLLDSAANQLKVAKRLAPRRGGSLRERVGKLDDRLVFVIGSPRSGTTFLAGAIGSLPGFVDLGEVAPVKAAVPELAALEPEEAARRLRKILAVARRVGLVGSVRAVEQTPELAHVASIIPLAYPLATVVHIVRDGRDVVSSLLEKPWLRPQQAKADDAGIAYGSYARFWVEPERRARVRARQRRAPCRVGVAEIRRRRPYHAAVRVRGSLRGACG